MTDQTPDSSTTPQSAPSEALSFNPDQVASLRDTWISAGHDPAEFDRAAAEPATATDQAPANPDGSPIQSLSDMKTPTLAGHEAYALANALREAGMSEARIQAALVADGFEAQSQDPRTDDQRAFDDAFSAPEPSAYRIDYQGRGAERMDMADLAAFNQAATEWASAVGLPVGVGEAVIERAMDVGQWWSKADPVDREVFQREQSAELERMAGGPEEAKAAIKRAASVLADGVIAQGGNESHMRALLEAGCANDAGFIMHLANHAARRAARG